VSFSPNGQLLVVTEKAANMIDTYTVGDDGLPSDPIPTASNGMTPFGFAFDRRANVIVSEAFGAMPGQAAVSSYDSSDDGTLTVLSGSVPDHQTAACWIAISEHGRYAYTTNTGSGNISSYRMQCDDLTLLSPVAADLGNGSSPIDMALAGNYLYVHAAGTRKIELFRVRSDGRLTLVSSVGGLPPGAQGIATTEPR